MASKTDDSLQFPRVGDAELGQLLAAALAPLNAQTRMPVHDKQMYIGRMDSIAQDAYNKLADRLCDDLVQSGGIQCTRQTDERGDEVFGARLMLVVDYEKLAHVFAELKTREEEQPNG